MIRRSGTASYVSSTRHRAAALMGDSVTADGASYIVELHGNFVGTHAHVPLGHKAPTGNTMVLVVSAATGQITDLSITERSPNLSAIATPAAL